MRTKIAKLASDLLISEYNNGYGIRCEAITKVCKENNIEFKVLWAEIIKQGNMELL